MALGVPLLRTGSVILFCVANSGEKSTEEEWHLESLVWEQETKQRSVSGLSLSLVGVHLCQGCPSADLMSSHIDPVQFCMNGTNIDLMT